MERSLAASSVFPFARYDIIPFSDLSFIKCEQMKKSAHRNAVFYVKFYIVQDKKGIFAGVKAFRARTRENRFSIRKITESNS